MQIEPTRIWREGNRYKAEDQAGDVYDVEALKWDQDTIAVPHQKGTTYQAADARWHVTVGAGPSLYLTARSTSAKAPCQTNVFPNKEIK
ncbi:MAG: hypothetical protein GYB52_11665 [Rhodospirillales bacterium]|nr:hypothetical protein [Rhodospirillales bacterium]